MTTTTLAPGYHPHDGYDIVCYQWDDRSYLGSGTIGPEFSYDGGRITLDGRPFAAQLRASLDNAKTYARPIARVEIRRDRETIATLTEAEAWDLVAEAGPWIVYADYEDGVTKTEYTTKTEAHDAALAAAQSSGGGTPRPDYVAVLDCLGRTEWSDYPTQFTRPTDPRAGGDVTNAERADAIDHTLATYKATLDHDDDWLITDVLADLMHWCDRNAIDFEAELHRARTHYDAETKAETETENSDDPVIIRDSHGTPMFDMDRLTEAVKQPRTHSHRFV